MELTLYAYGSSFIDFYKDNLFLATARLIPKFEYRKIGFQIDSILKNY